ncbi:MAG: DUF58 domain-containing protein [Deltaproteobacteria bacterium]|nr:DUF58 domain-containing protein [Deltaproteobacteria bacterium]
MKQGARGGRASGRFKRLKRRIFPRGLRFTREGKVYVLVTLGVGFAAVNTGNNLLFLVLGLMLGLIIVSGILSEATLRGLVPCRKCPPRVEAGRTFSVELSLKNEKRRVASYSVELRDEIDGQPFKRRCFFLRVAPGEERAISYRCELPRRGLARFDGIVVSTRFPFGLFEKRRFATFESEVIVLPAPLDVRLPSDMVVHGAGGRTAERRGPGQDFLELREMATGDDPRRIHWPSSARTGTLFLSETEAEAQGFVEVVLDPAPAGPGEDGLAQAELNIRAAGSLVREAVRRGLAVRLVTAPPAALTAHGRDGAVDLLDHLALIDPQEARASSPPVGRSAGAVLVGPRARGNGVSHRIALPRPAAQGA